MDTHSLTMSEKKISLSESELDLQ